MFRTRLISGIVLMAIAIAVLVNGSYFLFGTIALISVVGLFELYRAMGTHKSAPALIGYISSIVIDCILLVDTVDYVKDKRFEYLIVWLIFTFMVMMAFYVIQYPKYNSEQMTMMFFGLFYVTIMMSYVCRLRFVENGIVYVWLIFIGAWGSDTCAYCVGKLIGKHKLPSKLSPNKTIEGCVGGVLGAALIGFLYSLVMPSLGVVKDDAPWQVALICGVAAIISQIGDLTASAIKRNRDIKDYGKLIPGHGGILDRFDSIIFIAPVVYYFVTYFGL